MTTGWHPYEQWLRPIGWRLTEGDQQASQVLAHATLSIIERDQDETYAVSAGPPGFAGFATMEDVIQKDPLENSEVTSQQRSRKA